MDHSKTMPCVLCDSKKSGGHPVLSFWASEVQKQFPNAHISAIFRDQYYQDLAFRDGHSRLKWPDSKHNNMLGGKPYSLAVDFFRLHEQGMAVWEFSFFKEINDWLMEQGAPIVWGGTWEKFKDYPHFQLSGEVS